MTFVLHQISNPSLQKLGYGNLGQYAVGASACPLDWWPNRSKISRELSSELHELVDHKAEKRILRSNSYLQQVTLFGWLDWQDDIGLDRATTQMLTTSCLARWTRSVSLQALQDHTHLVCNWILSFTSWPHSSLLWCFGSCQHREVCSERALQVTDARRTTCTLFWPVIDEMRLRARRGISNRCGYDGVPQRWSLGTDVLWGIIVFVLLMYIAMC